jgi:glycosyltransferase involved in cell wall biosynthesis
MIVALQADYAIKVITTAYDLNATKPYENIELNHWNTIELNNRVETIDVWYSDTKKISTSTMLRVLKEASPDFIFINGLFTNWFFQPLWLLRMGKLSKVQVIVSPRGMLQEGALQVKPFKKKVYLGLFNFMGMFNYVKWHSTNPSETIDIQKSINSKAVVIEAANIPKAPLPNITYLAKNSGQLSLIYLSIITPKKNLLLLLRTLLSAKVNISLAIYGPIKEQAYWQQCEEIIGQMPSNIQVDYSGDILPTKVQATIQQYHALISLTQGENFGHALYESFSCGRPIITSYFTPWNNLEHLKAGWNTDIQSVQNIGLLLQEVSAMNQADFDGYYDGSWQLAKAYYEQSDFKIHYKQLFS